MSSDNSSVHVVEAVLHEDDLYKLLNLDSQVPLGELYEATGKLIDKIRLQLDLAQSEKDKQDVHKAENKLKQALLLQVQQQVEKHGIQNAFGVTAQNALVANLDKVYENLVISTDQKSMDTWNLLNNNAIAQLQNHNAWGQESFAPTAMELDSTEAPTVLQEYAKTMNDPAAWYHKMKDFILATNSKFANAKEGYDSIDQKIIDIYAYADIKNWQSLQCEETQVGSFKLKLSHECSDKRFQTALPSVYVYKEGLMLQNLRDYIQALKTDAITQEQHETLFRHLGNYWAASPTKIICVNQNVPILNFSFVPIGLQNVPTDFINPTFKIGDNVSYNDRISLRGGTVKDILRLANGILLYALLLEDNSTVQAHEGQLNKIASSQLSEELKFLNDEWIGNIDDIVQEDKTIKDRTRQLQAQTSFEANNELPEDIDEVVTDDDIEDSESDSSESEDDVESISSLWSPVDDLKDVELPASEVTAEFDIDDDFGVGNMELGVTDMVHDSGENGEEESTDEEESTVGVDVDKLRPFNGRLQSTDFDEDVIDQDVLGDLKESPTGLVSSTEQQSDALNDVDQLDSKRVSARDNYLPNETIEDVLADLRQESTGTGQSVDSDTLLSEQTASRPIQMNGSTPNRSDSRPMSSTPKVSQRHPPGKRSITFADFQSMKRLTKESTSRISTRWPQLGPLLKFAVTEAPGQQEAKLSPVNSGELLIARSVLNTHVLFKVTNAITAGLGRHLKEFMDPLLRGVRMLRLDRLFVSEGNSKIIGFVMIENLIISESDLTQAIRTRLSRCLKRLLPKYKSHVLFDFNPRLQVAAKTSSKAGISVWVFTLEIQ